MALISLKVNGQVRTVDADLECPLVYVLRDKLSLNVGVDCRMGQCGACTVLLDNVPTRTCLLAVARVTGQEIVTPEELCEEVVELPERFGQW